MEALSTNSPIPSPKFEPDIEKIKRTLVHKGVHPTPRIVRSLRKKEIQKYNRKLKRLTERQADQSPPLSESQKQLIAEETHFLTLRSEYKEFSKAIEAKPAGGLMVGRPWERLERVNLKELTGFRTGYNRDNLKKESLRELRKLFEARKLEELQWVLDDDVELKEEWLESENDHRDAMERRRGDGEVIRFLVDRLSSRPISMRDWKFSRMMIRSGLQFNEGQLLKILDALGAKGCWKQALSVVEWVYNLKSHSHSKSRFVYTKLLAVLGMSRKPQEALQIFHLMRGDGQIYPDMAAYHSIAVTLGQAGLLKQLLKVVECMRQQPSRKVRNKCRKSWDPAVEPDLVVYNAILNACIPTLEWKGVYWVFTQLRKSGLRPNGATYGLSMEVMLKSGKYEQLHKLFTKLKKSGETLKANTYRVLVKAFWEEGNVNGAIEAVRDMEQRGVVGSASVYYELACCLCYNGRWQDALVEVEKMKTLSHMKPLVVTFTGMILSSFDGGHIDDCISIFEYMKQKCAPNIGTINSMLKVYGRNDMFLKAKDLFEEIKRKADCSSHSSAVPSLVPDEYTYGSMLEAAASALQWEYFENVYREMALSGYRLDQSKHARLLVEASRAGKWYLLDHAFDSILEAGQIPHPLLFTEMILHLTTQDNYEQAVTLVRTMGYAPFQVSERQWTELFEGNRDRICWKNLKKLLDALGNCDASEATVSNLSRSLQSLCKLGIPENTSQSVACDHDVTDGLQLPGSENTENMKLHPDRVTDCCDESLDIIPVNHASLNMKVKSDSEVSPWSQSSSEGVLGTDQFSDRSINELSTIDLCDDSEDDEEGLNMLLDGFDDSYDSNLPSVNEILKTWKEERKTDGLFLHPLN
ncbi:pentatricopeptide repeat-containing protein At5g67570, chloroplastic isoform X2 [Benincasa hispida]|uniref:pentatricopeptide repeat-containing protein At5g67570, chloroplastic isoform X2 n=1 Tax=Benincasa hispida TaxID=102211 RepID=UPI0019000089|nr:pentatricopeptide repeat-containing protein At5g67570, chloroplastic isoform X2 [Benincasa hispida]